MAAFETKVKEVFHLNELKNFQKESLAALLKGRDVFLSIKTGGGKSICYQGFHTAFSATLDDSILHSFLVISPLLSIMHERCHFLNTLGFHSAYIGKLITFL